MPQRRRRKRVGASTAAGIAVADAPNRVWAVDFQFDATTDGRPVKIVSIVDEHTRECLGGLVERCVTADDLIDELDRLATQRGYPTVLRCDNGPELACAAMTDWAGDRLLLAFIPPGQPWRNGYIESFNSRVRDECRTSTSSGPWRTPASSSQIGSINTTTTDPTPPSTTRRQPATPPPAPINNPPTQLEQ